MSKKNKTIIGIDPGKSGAIALWDEGIDKVFKCPVNVNGMSSIMHSLNNTGWVDGGGEIVAYIERVHAFPTDGRSSAFKFGVNYGQWLGILSTLNIETVLVTPQKWMKYWKDKFKIKLPKNKPERKRKLKELAALYTDKPDFRPINEIQKEHLDIVIQALEGNLKIFKLFRDELSNKQQKDLLYPMVLELKNLCEECIPVFQPLD